jgi:crotonobetainyl-CoA:carnitine CoA-transferase CaiB-like acyl-CoA transferase
MLARPSTSLGSPPSPQGPWTRQDEIGELIAQRLATATTPMGCPHGAAEDLVAPVQGYAQIVQDPQIKHMKSLVTVPGEGDTGAPVTQPRCRL